jgi:hypothetical protein
LTSSTTKKAVIRRFERAPLAGYVNPASYLQPGGVELLSPEGEFSRVPFEEIKSIAFVRDLETASDPERLVFQPRPKVEGLWIRLHLRDGEIMEGVMPNNLLQVEPYGFTLIPPDAYGNQQRIFVPRAALLSVAVLGVVGSPLRKRRPKETPKEQIGLFEE